jgi:predicted ATPase/DNA-binding CsgD family transcriptional regulator
LSARERQVAEAYAAGQSHREIAERLFIAPATVRTHLSTIYRKLNVSTKIELLQALVSAADSAGNRQLMVLSAVLDRMPTSAGRLNSEETAALVGTFRAIVTEAAAREVPRSVPTVHQRGYRSIAPVEDSTRPAPVASPSAAEPVVSPPVRSLSPALPRLVGRDAELTRLQGALAAALEGGRQMVLVTGVPGIGKSALLEAFLASLAERPDLWLARGQCLPQVGPGEPYLPVLEALGSLCREPGAAPVQAALGRYAPIWLTQLPTLLTEAELDALQRRVGGMGPERMLRQMAEAVEALTVERLLVLCFDDLQWSDRATLELIDALARRQPKARLLIVGAYRTTELVGADHPLLALKQDLHLRGRCAELALEPLPGAAVAAYCARRFGVDEAPSMRALPRLVQERSGGNPLFMTAILDDLVRRGVILHREGRWSVAEPMQELAVPTSVREFIASELERLEPDQQRLLEAASVAGPEFSAAALAAALAAEAAEEEIEAWVTDLVRRQRFLRPAAVGEDRDGAVAARFVFRHDLYREVVYARLSLGRRSTLHRRIGEWREQAYGERAKDIAATLAVHFEEAGDWLRAARYRRHASDQAQRRHAPREATDHARRGVMLIQRVPPSQERIREELLLQQALAVAVTTAGGFAVPELSRVYARARELCDEVEDLDSSVSVLCGLQNLALHQGDCRRASDLANQLLSLGQQRLEPVPLLQACAAAASTRFFMGEPAEAVLHTARGLALYDVRHHQHLADVYGEDPGVLCYLAAGCAQWMLGYPDRARRHIDDGLSLSRELGYPFVAAQALWGGGIVYQHCGDVDRVRKHAEALFRLCREGQIVLWLGGARILRGWTLMQQGRAQLGAARLRRGIDHWSATGTLHHRPYFLALLTKALGQDGATEAAWSAVKEARAIAENTGERWYEAELHRLTGELARSEGEGATAEAWFQRALEIARRQDAKSWELRAATGLARLWRDQGRRDDADDLLAPVYAWFTEGFDTADLIEAKAMLTELA